MNGRRLYWDSVRELPNQDKPPLKQYREMRLEVKFVAVKLCALVRRVTVEKTTTSKVLLSVSPGIREGNARSKLLTSTTMNTNNHEKSSILRWKPKIVSRNSASSTYTA